MKNFIVFLLIFIVLFNISLFAKKLASLPELEKPYKMKVYKGKLIVSDHSVKLHMYSMKDFSYKLLLKKGQGPREVLSPPDIGVYPNEIFAFGIWRGCSFTLDGVLKREYKAKISLNRALRVGENFAILSVSRSKISGSAEEISIYQYTEDNEFKYKKMIYHNPTQKAKKTGGKYDYPLIKSYFGFIVDDDKVFIGNTDMGGKFEIYDSDGGTVSTFRIDLRPVKISDQFKKEFLEQVKQSPHYNIVNNMYHIYFPEYFPAYYRFAVNDKKIYILTYNKKDNRREVIISDYYGKILGHTYVAWIENYVHTNFSIEDDKFYYIKENEDTEEWELHVEDIK